MTSLETSNVYEITWENDIANRIEELYKTKKKSPLLVGVVGIPGSGKTTSVKLLSDILQKKQIGNLIMPMDGYHYPLATLKSFENADDAVYRRGAPDTFDANRLRQDLLEIQKGSVSVKIPDFDHAVGDPLEDAFTFVPSQHSIVICEGLYLLHDGDGWDINDLFDFSVYINSDVDMCVNRLKIRNQCIPGYTKEEIFIRCEKVDRANAMKVLGSQDRADVTVDSVAC